MTVALYSVIDEDDGAVRHHWETTEGQARQYHHDDYSHLTLTGPTGLILERPRRSTGAACQHCGTDVNWSPVAHGFVHVRSGSAECPS